MSKNYNDITIALAGIVQAVSLVDDLANHGHCEQEPYETSLASLFKIDSTTVTDVFGGAKAVRYGLVQLERLLGAGDRPFSKTSRQYFLSLLFLEKKLRQDEGLSEDLRRKIQQTSERSHFFPAMSQEVITQLAGIYSDTIAQISPRIMILGKEDILSTEEIVFKIRALLLAGFRAVVLWRQVAGNRWQFIFNRNQLLAACRAEQ